MLLDSGLMYFSFERFLALDKLCDIVADNFSFGFCFVFCFRWCCTGSVRKNEEEPGLPRDQLSGPKLFSRENFEKNKIEAAALRGFDGMSVYVPKVRNSSP